MSEFSTGVGCMVEGSSGWCVAAVDCASACQFVGRVVIVGAPVENPDTLSTSARLRQVQADLAASQADLTRALQELDAIGVKLVQALRERGELSDLVDKISAELTKTQKERNSLARRCFVRFTQAEGLRAELASARQEIASVHNQLGGAQLLIEQLRAEARFPKPDNESEIR